MKKILTIILFSAFALTACGSDENKTLTEKSETENTANTESASNQNKPADDDPLAIKGEVIELDIPTVQCGTCKKNIEKALNKLDGIYKVNVNIKSKRCLVDFDNTKTNLSSIEGAIVSAGYQANDKPADKEAYDKLDDCCKIGGHD
ncbi:MAG TPA: cation transporter [Ignavibacteria bacterium]|nr:hypothetical protein [Bacteroidota bacterium]HRI86561.1 cation transporter [Ignavibacteria bacterium]HRJ99698.1 cation transporter [Ignavibacteria bacterium]